MSIEAGVGAQSDLSRDSFLNAPAASSPGLGPRHKNFTALVDQHACAAVILSPLPKGATNDAPRSKPDAARSDRE